MHYVFVFLPYLGKELYSFVFNSFYNNIIFTYIIDLPLDPLTHRMMMDLILGATKIHLQWAGPIEEPMHTEDTSKQNEIKLHKCR